MMPWCYTHVSPPGRGYPLCRHVWSGRSREICVEIRVLQEDSF